MEPTACQRVTDNLAALVDLGEPAASTSAPLDGLREELRAHVSRCAACASSLESYRATVTLLRALPAKPVPADFLSWVQRGVIEPTRGG
jgi:anti-sigma factor RsiW